jgi:hypothetical protein
MHIYRGEGGFLRQEPTANRGKYLKLREGMLMPRESSKEGQNLQPLYTLTRKITSNSHLLVYIKENG